MSQKNKTNILYFESSSMKELYECMKEWQAVNQKRLLSINIQNDAGKFCCIALTNPTEVVITDICGNNCADVDGLGYLHVTLDVG